MPALIGVLLDVSGSMQRSVGQVNKKRIKKEAGSWARSIFKTMDELVKHDVGERNKVFALAYGGVFNEVFDMLGSLELLETPIPCVESTKTKEELLQEILDILQKNGARYVKEWAKMKTLMDVVSREEALTINSMLHSSQDFAGAVVRNVLPRVCITGSLVELPKPYLVRVDDDDRLGIVCVGGFGGFVPVGYREVGGPTLAQRVVAAITNAVGKLMVNRETESTKKEIRDAFDEGIELSRNYKLKENLSAFSVTRARRILKKTNKDSGEVNEGQIDRWMDDIRPFIYGRTPMIRAVNTAIQTIKKECYDKNGSQRVFDKVLVILSDGHPTDGWHPPKWELDRLGVYVVCAYISDDNLDHPRQLHGQKRPEWSEEAGFMFDLSSDIPANKVPRTMFIKKQWKIDFEGNKTKLFLQVNHPDLLEDVVDLARDLVMSQDALSDALASVDLDLYINKASDDFSAKEQEGATCYANAAATAMHLAMKRIAGREGGCPDFFQLRDKFIDSFGSKANNTFNVLQQMCPKYRLQCRKVDTEGAMRAIVAKSPLVAVFRLTRFEWQKFGEFFAENPCGTLSEEDEIIDTSTPRSQLRGHAVVMVGFDAHGLRFLNSKGDRFGNHGFFRVQNAKVLQMEFIEVFWEEHDLTLSEREHWNKHGHSVAKKLVESLKGLQTAKCKCPLCFEESPVSNFSGNVFLARCPVCKDTFQTQGPNGSQDLALNLYLQSIADEEEFNSKKSLK